MTVQATVGSAVLATAVGVGTAGGDGTTPLLVAQTTTQTLAFTGASHTLLLVTVAMLMILAGTLLNGLTRRHAGVAAVGLSAAGPPLRL